jgi:hypothetical protein
MGVAFSAHFCTFDMPPVGALSKPHYCIHVRSFTDCRSSQTLNMSVLDRLIARANSRGGSLAQGSWQSESLCTLWKVCRLMVALSGRIDQSETVAARIVVRC